MLLNPSIITRLGLSSTIRSGRHVVEIDGREVLLTLGEFELLLDLVQARRGTRSGLTAPPNDNHAKTLLHQKVRRLRLAIDAVLGRGQGKLLVTHAAHSRYFLAIPAVALVADPSLADLAPYHLPQNLVDQMLNPPPPSAPSKAS
jgi:hypothetical protein